MRVQYVVVTVASGPIAIEPCKRRTPDYARVKVASIGLSVLCVGYIRFFVCFAGSMGPDSSEKFVYGPLCSFLCSYR